MDVFKALVVIDHVACVHVSNAFSHPLVLHTFVFSLGVTGVS